MTRFDETLHRLLNWTQVQAASERLAAQIVLEGGFENVDPIHPLGGKDGGKDALVEKDGERWIMAVYFPRGQKSFAEIKEKFQGDFTGVQANEAKGMAFVTNQELTQSERRDLTKAVSGPTEIFHLERVVTILDRPHMAGLRRQYLDIDFGATTGLAPSTRLEEMRRKSAARCAQRWQAIGLPQAEAWALAEDYSVGRVSGAMGPDSEKPIVVWIAPIGAGKSIAAEREHQAAIEFALEESEAPIPIFIHAREAAAGLEEICASEAAEVGEPRERGARVIVDGLDEVGQEIAGQLLGQARVLCGTWPDTTVLVVSRPLQVWLDPDEHLELPPLSASEAHACVELGAGREVTLAEIAAFPTELTATLVQPMFALLAGLWLRENKGSPRAPVDLLGELGKRATPDGADRTLLRKLAVRSVQRDLGSVPVGDVVRPSQLSQLLDSGIVVEEGQRVEFALPALAQWFSAEAILESDIGLEEILKAPDDLDLWLYPLALSISYGSSDDAGTILGGLLENEAGFALRVLDIVFKQAVLEGSPAPPWRDAGEKVRDALERLRDALRPAGPLLSDSDVNGDLAPMALATNGNRLTIAFYRGDDRGSLSELPDDIDFFHAGPEWGSIRGAPVGPGAAWAWQWSRDVIKDGFKRLLEDRAFPISIDSPLAHEEVWAWATKVENRPQLFCERLALEPLIKRITKMVPAGIEPPAVQIQFPGQRRHDLIGALSYLRVLEADGRDVLEAPIPTADRKSGGGWIGDFYSDERLLEVAEAIYLQAIQAYEELVDSWLPGLIPQLEHKVLMPVRVVGRLNPGRDNSEGIVIPTLAGYLECLHGDSSEVAIETDGARYDYSAGRANWEAQKAARPRARRWLAGMSGGMSFEVGQTTPVSDAVYGWLARDLQRLGMASPLDGNSSRDGMTLWNIQPRSWKELVADPE